MKVLYERCCGLDVHKSSIAACISYLSGNISLGGSIVSQNKRRRVHEEATTQRASRQQELWNNLSEKTASIKNWPHRNWCPWPTGSEV